MTWNAALFVLLRNIFGWLKVTWYNVVCSEYPSLQNCISDLLGSTLCAVLISSKPFISSLACPGDGFGIWFDTDCLHRSRNYSKSLLLGDHGYYQTRPQYSSDYCQWLFIDFSIKALEAWEPLSTYRDWRAWYCRKTYSYNQYLYFDSQFFRHTEGSSWGRLKVISSRSSMTSYNYCSQ